MEVRRGVRNVQNWTFQSEAGLSDVNVENVEVGTK